MLSLFAAQAGARRVYAVEASGFYELAEQNARRNGFEAVIRVVHGRVEDVTLPEQADVIVSEWMGFYLLHESMLDSVIAGRDRWVRAAADHRDTPGEPSELSEVQLFSLCLMLLFELLF